MKLQNDTNQEPGASLQSEICLTGVDGWGIYFASKMTTKFTASSSCRSYILWKNIIRLPIVVLTILFTMIVVLAIVRMITAMIITFIIVMLMIFILISTFSSDHS